MDGSNRGDQLAGALTVESRAVGTVDLLAGAELDAYEEAMHQLATRMAVQAARELMLGSAGAGRGAVRRR